MGIDFIDDFARTCRPGKVIRSVTSTGIQRSGIDREKIISIDNNALRISPPLKPGWGKTALTYGPYKRVNGLAFGVLALNGHNTSHATHVDEGVKKRMIQWALGHNKKKITIIKRLIQWLLTTNKALTFRKIKWWLAIHPKKQLPELEENFSVGCYADTHLKDITAKGNYFVMHAALGNNGELWNKAGDSFIPSITGVHNIPVYYVVILREKGAVYYTASYPDAHEVGAYPEFRPIAVDVFDTTKELYCGIHQSVLGQIGFRADTRVYKTRLKLLEDHTQWYGYAHAADSFNNEGTLHSAPAQIGGKWHVYNGRFFKKNGCVIPGKRENMGIIAPESVSGLIHYVLSVGNVIDFSVIWRFKDRSHYWEIAFSDHSLFLYCVNNGKKDFIARETGLALPKGDTTLQILDNGTVFSIFINNDIAFKRRFTDERLQDGRGTGFVVNNHDTFTAIRSFEAHPRAVDLSRYFNTDILEVKSGETQIIADNFKGPGGIHLSARKTTTGNRRWRKEYGRGILQLTGNMACKVLASTSKPNPGSTAYTVAWDNPGFADIRVDITPPGTRRGDGEKTRAGIILWQNPRHFITISMWLVDAYEGASVALFSNLDGFEDIYDAVWTMVGNRISWGKKITLRVVCDGMHVMVYIDHEPVLYRSLRDVRPACKGMNINRVGLVANWEWGDDTGSVFTNFTVLQ